MASFGWNVMPEEYGGGKSIVQGNYETLRDAQGIGGWDPDELESLDGLRRFAHAMGMSVGLSCELSAAMQMFAHYATDHIAAFEGWLGIYPNRDDDEEMRRQRVATEWVRQISAIVTSMNAELVAIDSRFSIVDVDWDAESTTELGKPFEALDGSDAFDPGGTRSSTALPNYSSEFVLRVLFDLGSGVAPNADELKKIAEAKRYLNKALPAWMTFSLGTELGFILDTSLLDGGMLEDP